jgi:hypothetical protein
MTKNQVIAAIAVCLLSATTAYAKSPQVVTQPTCSEPNCLEFNDTTPEELTARTIDTVSPVTGSAIVTFHGMLRCAPGRRELVRHVNFQTQIVKLGDATPNGVDKGGHAIIGLLYNNFSGGPNYVANSFNLASTRVFNVVRGKPLRLAFRIERMSMPDDVACAVEKSSAFTVQFVG